MKFISKISKQGEDYFIRVPRDRRDGIKQLHKPGMNLFVIVEAAWKEGETLE